MASDLTDTPVHISDYTRKNLSKILLSKVLAPFDVTVNLTNEPNYHLPLNKTQISKIERGREKGERSKKITLNPRQLAHSAIPVKSGGAVLSLKSSSRASSSASEAIPVHIQSNTSMPDTATKSVPSKVPSAPIAVTQENAVPEELLLQDMRKKKVAKSKKGEPYAGGWLKQLVLHQMTPVDGGRALSPQEASMHQALRQAGTR